MMKLPSTFALLMDEIPGFVRAELCNGKILLTVRDFHQKYDSLYGMRFFNHRTTVFGSVPMPEAETGQALGPLCEYSSNSHEAAIRYHVSLLCLLEMGKPLPKGDLA